MNTKQIINTIKNSLDYYEGIGRVVGEPMKFVDNLTPKVPRFIAEFYDEHIMFGIACVIEHAQNVDLVEDERVCDWFTSLCNRENKLYYNDVTAIILMKIYLFGYEVA